MPPSIVAIVFALSALYWGSFAEDSCSVVLSEGCFKGIEIKGPPCGRFTSFTEEERTYQSNATCTWLIKPDERNYTRITFNSFEVEPFPFTCDYSNRDVVRIYDGAAEDAPLLAALCGFDLPAPVIASGPEVLIIFTTDHNFNLAGFSATFTSEECAGCLNGGRCVGYNNCSCMDGWTGDLCEKPVCSPSCQNGGTCDSPFSCSCPSGWRGGSCEEPICSQGDCNHGICVAPNTCACDAGWRGETCSEPVCASPCLNGGSCVSPDGCNCSRGWEGPLCETPMCIGDANCRNGGTCVAPATCQCKDGYVGKGCEDASFVSAAKAAASYIGRLTHNENVSIGVLQPESNITVPNITAVCVDGVESCQAEHGLQDFRFSITIIDVERIEKVYSFAMTQMDSETFYPLRIECIGGAFPLDIGSAAAESALAFGLRMINNLKTLQGRNRVFYKRTVAYAPSRENVAPPFDGVRPYRNRYLIELLVDEIEPYNGKYMGLDEVFALNFTKEWDDGLFHLNSIKEETTPWPWKKASNTLPVPKPAWEDASSPSVQ